MMRFIFTYNLAYGRHLYYPYNGPAKSLCEAFKVKSITRYQIAKLVDAGLPIKSDGPSKRRRFKDEEGNENATCESESDRLDETDSGLHEQVEGEPEISREGK